MAEQTAVESLFMTLAITPMTDWYNVLEKAKEWEKEQMHKCASFWRGKENEIEKNMFEIWYNETYKK